MCVLLLLLLLDCEGVFVCGGLLANGHVFEVVGRMNRCGFSFLLEPGRWNE